MNAPGGEQAVNQAAAAVLHIAHESPSARDVQAVPALGTSRPEAIDGWAEIFQAMADSNRLRILLAVHYAPGINVTELADAVGMTANATSHALAALRVRGIVRSERAGRERRWSIASEQIHALLHEVGAAHPPSRAD